MQVEQYTGNKADYKVRTREEIEEIAKQQGVVCIWPTELELALDIDRPYWEPSKEQLRVEGMLHEYGIMMSSVHETRRRKN